MEVAEVARAGAMVLRNRIDDAGAEVLELRVNGVFVMDTAQTETEEALARTALGLVDRPRRVLVAGLGLGFTMHEVLADPRVEHVRVVEVEDALVGWMRDGTIPHGPGFLADDRLEVVVADARQAIAESRSATYDLVLLDVDNGPGFLVYEYNAALYQAGFLRQVREVLRPGGALAVWSSAESAELQRALGEVFGDVTTCRLPVTLQGRDESYWIYASGRAGIASRS